MFKAVGRVAERELEDVREGMHRDFFYGRLVSEVSTTVEEDRKKVDEVLLRNKVKSVKPKVRVVKGAKVEVEEVAFQYLRNGVVVNIKYRNLPTKNFRQVCE